MRPVWSLWRSGLSRAYRERREWWSSPGDQMLGYRDGGGQSFPWADVVLFNTGCI